MSRDFEKCEYCGMVTHEIEATDSGFQVCIETDGRGEYVSHQECCKRIRELEYLLVAIAEDLECVRYPKNDGTREWVDELASYLRGCAMAKITLTPKQMRILESFVYVSRTDQTTEEE